MPIWTQPSGPEYSPRGGFPLSELMQTWLQARELKKGRLQQQRDRTLLESLMQGEGMPTGTPMGMPTGMPAPTEPTSRIGKFMGGLGEFFTGGRVDPRSLPMSDIEKIMAESAIKAKFPSKSDLLTNLMIQQYMDKDVGVGPTAEIIPPKPATELPEGYEWTLEEKTETVKGVPRTVRRWKSTKIKEPAPLSVEKQEEKAIRKQMAINWLRGQDFPAAKKGGLALTHPRTREEAFAKVIYWGVDPSDPDIRAEIEKLPLQSEAIGEILGPIDRMRGLRRYPAMP